MFLYLLRNLKILLQSSGESLINLQDEVTLMLRVRFTDIDYNNHMNNARYLEALEMGRLAQLVRLGALRLTINEKLTPIVASIDVRYSTPLKYNQRFAVHSRLVGWNERWFFIRQQITRADDGKVCASALVRGALLKGRSPASPKELFSKIGKINVEPVHMPDYVKDFDLAEASLQRVIKDINHSDYPVEK